MSKLARIKQLFHNRFAIRKQLRWLLERSRPWLWRLALLILIDVLLSALSMGCTLLNKHLIDAATASGFDRRGATVLVVLTLSSLAMSAVSGVLSRLIREKYATGIRADVFHRTVHSGWLQLSGLHSEDVLTRITSDVDSVAGGVADLMPNLVYLVVRLLMAFVILYNYDHYLALTALLLGPLCVMAGWLFSGRLKEYETKLKVNNAEYRAFMQETVANITVLKTFQREKHADEQLEELRRKRLQLVRKRNVFSTVVNTVMGLLFRIGYLMAFIWGIWRISRGEITYGTMSVFLALVTQVQGPVLSIYNMMGQLIGVLASVDRIMELEALPAEPAAVPAPLKGAVGLRVHQVTFAYERLSHPDKEPGNAAPEKETVLRKADMEIAPGECVGLVSPSGCGKTTLARLILGLMQPESGEVLFYDGYGQNAPASPSTRHLIAYVPQGNTLATGTLRQNLLVGDENATDAEIWQALEISQAAAFVQELPDGLESRIGEKGIGLSEGQAQRIAIARALLRKAPFLILDEATSSLDVDNERQIMESLAARPNPPTCLIITHRPTLLGLCSRCYRIQDGCTEEVTNGSV